MQLSEITDLVKALVRDDSAVLSPEDVALTLQQALARYSQDAPVMLAADVGCNGDTAPLPAAWVNGKSQLKGVTAPHQDCTPTVTKVTTETGDVLQLSWFYSGTLRLQFTVPHQLDEVISTVFYSDTEALACYAAAICCDQLSAYYINEANNTIAADTTAHQLKSSEYRKQAATYRKRYSDHIGQKTPGSTAAGVVVSWGSRRRK
jgi:hypothetical protein